MDGFPCRDKFLWQKWWKYVSIKWLTTEIIITDVKGSEQFRLSLFQTNTMKPCPFCYERLSKNASRTAWKVLLRSLRTAASRCLQGCLLSESKAYPFFIMWSWEPRSIKTPCVCHRGFSRPTHTRQNVLTPCVVFKNTVFIYAAWMFSMSLLRSKAWNLQLDSLYLLLYNTEMWMKYSKAQVEDEDAGEFSFFMHRPCW